MRRSQLLALCLIVGASAGCDHVTKQFAYSALVGSAPVSLAADTVRFELALNRGAFLSLGAGFPEEVRNLFLLVLVPAVLLVACVILLRTRPITGAQIVGIGLYAGGGISNWLDRMLHDGAVTDFVSVGVGPVRTGIFNVADVAILFGLALFIFSYRSVHRPEPQAPAEA